MPNVTVGERILVHLSGFLRHADAYEVPVEMTQDGIAAVLGLSRAHVALELKRLRTTGKIQERMAHVAHARSRRKVYELTPAGQDLARRMRDHARTRTVRLSEPAGLREVSGSEAIEALRRAGLRESEAVQRVLAADVVEMPRPASPKVTVPSRPFVGREGSLEVLKQWLASDAPAVAVVIGVAGIGKTALVARLLEKEPRPTLVRRVYAHDDAHGLLSSIADFLARQGRRRLKAVITRPAYDPVEALAHIYTDTILHDARVLRFVIGMVGAERMMMGSDMPFPIGDLEPMKIVAAAGLRPDQAAAVNGGLARKVFKLK